MRRSGLLTLEDIALWLGPDHWPGTDRFRKTRRLLQRTGIPPAVKGTGRRPSLWRFKDLEPLAPLVARRADQAETA